jgi:hypothetical protein
MLKIVLSFLAFCAVPGWVYTKAATIRAGFDMFRTMFRPIGPRFVFFFVLFSGGWLFAGHPISAQQGPTEYQVKAAYLFNFLKFVEWPGDPSRDAQGPWVIGVVGDSSIGEELPPLVAGKTVQGRALQVRNFQPAEDLRGCNILFISASETKRLPSILAGLRGSSVLTVADMEHFVAAGGMIQFVMEDGSVRLAIDVGATSRARLKVSSKLLSLARAVTGADRGTNN